MCEKTADNWWNYKEAKKAAEKAVTVAKAPHYRDLNEKLESRDGERYLYRLAKFRHRQTENIEKFFVINDENGHLLTDRKKALKRWCDYFEKISTVEFPHPTIPSTAPTHGPVQEITVEEIEAALKKMRPGKARQLIYGSPTSAYAFLGLEKAFDRVPREVIWYALRQHGAPEELIEWVRILYSCPKSRVQAATGTSMEFPISVGKPVPWTLLYADDVMLASEDKVNSSDGCKLGVIAWSGLGSH
ncbi:unnamed protein product [Heligmosomoides polygyrus]|uniref:Reverse transcriptase domain-containing protein n=1 Tax=Heligmosomoides polygyrus TaxID=6339 RepID=A0A183FT30_HELPZ|nr:unnamed protein product [Heligmosomoides polygyrus]